MQTVGKAELLGTVRGSKGDHYEIVAGADGAVYCECWAWRRCKQRPRTCKHLRQFAREHPAVAVAYRMPEANQ